MNKYPFLNDLDVSQDVKIRLSHNLDRISRGSNNVLASPILKSVSIDEILSSWDKVFQANTDKMSKELIDLEKSNRSEVSPRSLALPWGDRIAGVLEYFDKPSISKLPRVDNNVIYSGRRRLRPLSEGRSKEYLKSNTNSGLPFYVRKSLVSNYVVSNFDDLLKRMDPCVLFTRTQENKKTRSVWGYPIADTLEEMRFYRPFLNVQRAKGWRAALAGPESVDIQVSRIIDNALLKKRKLLSIDFSSYDSTVKYGLQKIAFEHIKSFFQYDYVDQIDRILSRFNSIGLVTPSGVLTGKHGVPSGSTFTNEVDSVVQYLIAKTSGINDMDMCIQGDDGVYTVDDPKGLMKFFSSFGLKVNQKKSYISDNYVVYLQNLHSDNHRVNGICRGIYPTYRALGRILYPERFTDFGDRITGADFNSIRAITILENCRYHPLFPLLVKFIADLDKKSLRYSQQGLKAYINMLQSSYGVEGIFRYRYSDDVAGILSFETTKILSKLYGGG